MPYTTTHVLIGIIVIELFREYFIRDNRKFPRYYILIMAIASVFPDFEYIFQIPYLHKSLLHTLFVPVIFIILGLTSLKFKIKNSGVGKKHLKLSTIFFIFSAGSLVHILLDSIIRDGTMLFYPFSENIVGLNLISLIPISENLSLIILDTLMLFFWIFWMEFKLKISDYF